MAAIGETEPVGKYSLVGKVEESKLSGLVQFRLREGTPVHSELKSVVKLLLRTEARKHLKYFACCKVYEEGEDMTPH
jgi:hypothetical protein